jgi:uncharacterized protein YegP (UPF0339 family)
MGTIVLLSAPGVVRAQAKANAAKADAAKADAAKADTAKAKDQLKFEVYQDSAKEFRWRLVSGEDKDREVLATGGQGYKSKADCTHGVESIQKGSDKLKFEEYQDNAKQNRWRAKASNGQVVAASGSSYKTKADCDSAVETIKKGAAKAPVEEVKADKS